jgi:methionyl-tRNA synthetase
MIHRYRGGIVPAADEALLSRDEERALALSLDGVIDVAKSAAASFQLSFALREIWDVIGATNRYIVIREPWVLARDEAKRAELDTALHVAADAVRVIAELIRPFMPETGERTLRMLGIEPSPFLAIVDANALSPESRWSDSTLRG